MTIPEKVSLDRSNLIDDVYVSAKETYFQVVLVNREKKGFGPYFFRPETALGMSQTIRRFIGKKGNLITDFEELAEAARRHLVLQLSNGKKMAAEFLFRMPGVAIQRFISSGLRIYESQNNGNGGKHG